MQDVPKIVLKRLQETQAAGTHPDADLLTAFAEQSLIESERSRVMEHLSRCSDCRDVVAFALPTTEAVVVTASNHPTRTAWLSWPVLRWSVAVAGMIAITSLGILQYRHRQKSDALFSALNQSNETAATAEQALPPSPPASESQAEKQIQAQVQKKALSSQPDNLAMDRLVRQPNPTLPAASTMRGAPSRSVTGGARVGAAGGAAPKAAVSSPYNTFAAGDSKNATPRAAAKSAPSSSARHAIQVPPSSEALEVMQSDAAPAVGSAEKQMEQTLQYQYSIKSEDSKAKNSTTTQAASSSASAPAPAPPNFEPQAALGLVQSSSPRWSISADGALQRSVDAGKTWVDVNVNSEPMSNGSNRAVTAESTYGHENKKRKVETRPSQVFRAVAAWDSEVWAGGSSATLYHSADSGDHWTRVLPSSSGATLTGDIISIEFSDSQHGRIATSSGEVWVTTDDGQTWRRQ
jgi:hypothetical protein